MRLDIERRSVRSECPQGNSEICGIGRFKGPCFSCGGVYYHQSVCVQGDALDKWLVGAAVLLCVGCNVGEAEALTATIQRVGDDRQTKRC